MNEKHVMLSICIVLLGSVPICAGPGTTDTFLKWGTATDGLRAAVHVQESFRSTSDTACQTIVYVGAAASSVGPKLFLPTIGERFVADLTDSEGRSVARTPAGKLFGKDPPRIAHVSDKPRGGPNRWSVLLPSATHETQIANFDILQYFQAHAPGVYHLTVTVRLYRQEGGTLHLVELPSTVAEVRMP